ncbi:MAG TPA: 2-oxoglutarate dehydrogenase E1 component [Trueperaceae bacterium]|nr:2-oxoglutarate dehydrogenase E1 component [Trueperaceae bacterium]
MMHTEDELENELEDQLDSASLTYVEELFERYLQDPGDVPESWRVTFARMPLNGLAQRRRLGPSFRPRSLFNPGGGASAAASERALDRAGSDAATLQQRVERLVRNYRVRGHRLADLSPLGREPFEAPELDPSHYGFSEADMGRAVLETTFPSARTLGEVIEALKETYTRSIGAQFMHIDSLEVRRWLQERMEATRNRLSLSRERQLRILTKLTDAVIFEDFIQKKYVGAKSFSLEGGETLIPLLDQAIEKAGSQGVTEIVLGMAHRGRLNVLANILGKNPRTIFREFEDKDPEMHRGRGDVKYHLGYSNDWTTEEGRTIHLSLAFNPSHLEFVDPVVLGRVRAKQERVGDEARERVMPIVVHGDAAFIGEGVVQESLNLSGLAGYGVGGTLHIIVNNQVGFTTGPRQGRTSTYASDVAKMLQSPVFHVNGEDPEAVAQAIELAMDFRRAFKRDVVVDMYCYRRQGHNESDEPSFTQPVMYGKIKRRRSVRDGYLERLLTLGEVTREEADQIGDARREHLEHELSVARSDEFKPHYSAFEGLWTPYSDEVDADVEEPETGVDAARLAGILRSLTEVPETFNLNGKIARALKTRVAMAKGERPLDWAAAEALAFGTLLQDGVKVRLSGQDSERGTFSQRHAVFHDGRDGHEYVPLQHVGEGQGPFEVHNSPLSEAGVLGFEYGYSLDTPDGLVLWEAQFGDFANAAQVIVDQFIASAEDKWKRLSGLVMLLPHGMEGQGPEHSSARLERYLQLCAEDNLQVAYPTTPAQYFHLLRRQVVRPLRKPLIVMTPKSLLRHPQATSPLEDLTGARRFERVLRDGRVEPGKVGRVLMASGKVAYDLMAARDDRERDDVAIVRVEQLYPLPDEAVAAALEGIPAEAPVLWVQEEPENMGGWRFMRVKWGDRLLGRPFLGVSRPASASPATGSGAAHRLEQAELIRTAFEMDV